MNEQNETDKNPITEEQIRQELQSGVVLGHRVDFIEPKEMTPKNLTVGVKEKRIRELAQQVDFDPLTPDEQQRIKELQQESYISDLIPFLEAFLETPLVEDGFGNNDGLVPIEEKEEEEEEFDPNVPLNRDTFQKQVRKKDPQYEAVLIKNAYRPNQMGFMSQALDLITDILPEDPSISDDVKEKVLRAQQLMTKISYLKSYYKNLDQDSKKLVVAANRVAAMTALQGLANRPIKEENFQFLEESSRKINLPILRELSTDDQDLQVLEDFYDTYKHEEESTPYSPELIRKISELVLPIMSELKAIRNLLPPFTERIRAIKSGKVRDPELESIIKPLESIVERIVIILPLMEAFTKTFKGQMVYDYFKTHPTESSDQAKNEETFLKDLRGSLSEYEDLSLAS